MKFLMIVIVSAITGAVISSAILMSKSGFLQENHAVNDNNEQIAELSTKMQRSEDVLKKISESISLIEQRDRSVDVSQGSVVMPGSSKTAESEENISGKQIKRNLVSVSSQDIILDKKAEEKLITRLNDSAYTSSKTMADFMGSEEMYHLPAASRKKIVEEMMRKLNDGSIDVMQFTKGMALQK